MNLILIFLRESSSSGSPATLIYGSIRNGEGVRMVLDTESLLGIALLGNMALRSVQMAPINSNGILLRAVGSNLSTGHSAT